MRPLDPVRLFTNFSFLLEHDLFLNFIPATYHLCFNMILKVCLLGRHQKRARVYRQGQKEDHLRVIINLWTELTEEEMTRKKSRWAFLLREKVMLGSVLFDINRSDSMKGR